MIEYDTAFAERREACVFGWFKGRRALYTDGEIDLALSPAGFLETGDGIRDGYTFDIRLAGDTKSVGYISLRLGESPQLYYLGHIGYRVHAQYRGHGYAGKAVRLLIPLMRSEGLLHPVITTDVTNTASRKTCLRAGCVLERIAPVPAEYREICAGSLYKCRYILCIAPEEENV